MKMKGIVHDSMMFSGSKGLTLGVRELWRYTLVHGTYMVVELL